MIVTNKNWKIMAAAAVLTCAALLGFVACNGSNNVAAPASCDLGGTADGCYGLTTAAGAPVLGTGAPTTQTATCDVTYTPADLGSFNDDGAAKVIQLGTQGGANIAFTVISGALSAKAYTLGAGDIGALIFTADATNPWLACSGTLTISDYTAGALISGSWDFTAYATGASCAGNYYYSSGTFTDIPYCANE